MWVGSGVTSRLGDFCVRGDHLVGLGTRGRLAGGMAAARFQHVGSCSARARTRGCEEVTVRTQQAGHGMSCHTSSFPPLPPPSPLPGGRPVSQRMTRRGPRRGTGRERGGANRKIEDRNVLPPASSSRAAPTSAVKRSFFRWSSVLPILANCSDACPSNHSWCCSSVSASGGADLLMNLSIPVFINSPGSFMRLVEIYWSGIV